jgi:hypothetical protein
MGSLDADVGVGGWSVARGLAAQGIGGRVCGQRRLRNNAATVVPA